MLIYSHSCLEGRIYKRLKRLLEMNHEKTQPNLLIKLNCACQIIEMVTGTPGLMVCPLHTVGTTRLLDQTLADFTYTTTVAWTSHSPKECRR